MSVVRTYSPAEVAAWARRGPEPISIDLPGWSREERDPLPNQHESVLRRGGCSVTVVRCWDMPLSPGNPLRILARRPIAVAGRSCDLVRATYSTDEWAFDVVYLQGADWCARLVFEACAPEVVDTICGRHVVLRAPLEGPARRRFRTLQSLIRRVESQRTDLAGVDPARPETFFAKKKAISTAVANGTALHRALWQEGFFDDVHLQLVGDYLEAKWSELRTREGEEEIVLHDTYRRAAGQ